MMRLLSLARYRASSRLLSPWNSNRIPPLCGRTDMQMWLSSSNSGSGSGPGDDNNNNNVNLNNKSDPFGVDFKDGNENLGQELPPSYIRDKATGKFTYDVENELSSKDEAILKANDQETILQDRLADAYGTPTSTHGSNTTSQSQDENMENDNLHERLAKWVDEQDTAMNTLGRSPSHVSLTDDDKEDMGGFHDTTDSDFSQRLSLQEFQSFSRYMKQKHDVLVTSDDVPVDPNSSASDGTEHVPKGSQLEVENPDLAYLTPPAQREMQGMSSMLSGTPMANDNTAGAADDPFADLAPHDLNPTRLVNRKKAKLIPKQLLHHNNLALLRRYVSPNGSIMNRQQSRLGAKDQRKVSKLIKRARCLGLIPHIGQWKYDNRGNKYEHDIHEERDWENELVTRGLVVRRDNKNKKPSSPL